MKYEVKEKLRSIVNEELEKLNYVNCMNDVLRKVKIDELKNVKCKVVGLENYRRIDLFRVNDFIDVVENGGNYKDGLIRNNLLENRLSNMLDKIKNELNCEEIRIESCSKFCGRFSEYYYFIIYK